MKTTKKTPPPKSVQTIPMMIEPKLIQDRAALAEGKTPTRTLNIDAATITMNVNGPAYFLSGSIAIIGIFGPMFKGFASWGYADQAEIRASVRAAANDPAVTGIMLFIDSPGGSVSGTQDLADEIKSADKVKPVYAYIEDCGCSAAYWTAASARAVYANDSAIVGSIGVITEIVDASKYYEAMGIRIIPIITGNKKNVGDPSQPATDDGIAYMQGLIDTLFEKFAGAVSKSRGISVEKIKKMEAAVFVGSQAVENKLLDGVMSFDKAFAALAKEAKKSDASANRKAKALLAIEEMES